MAKLNGNTRNAMARRFIKAVRAIAEYHVSRGELVIKQHMTEEEGHAKTMADTLAKYRSHYVRAISYSKGVTLDNGDELAQALRGMTPMMVMALADDVLGELPGTHYERYQFLNVGQQRMNAGNRIRAAIKAGKVTVVGVIKAAAKIEIEFPDTETEV